MPHITWQLPCGKQQHALPVEHTGLHSLVEPAVMFRSQQLNQLCQDPASLCKQAAHDNTYGQAHAQLHGAHALLWHKPPAHPR